MKRPNVEMSCTETGSFCLSATLPHLCVLCSLFLMLLQPQVLRLLDTLKIKHNFQGNNEGCIEIDPLEVKAYMER